MCLESSNVDRVVTLSQNTPFSASWFFHAATSGFRDTVHHPYISPVFVGNVFTPLFLYFLQSASCVI